MGSCLMIFKIRMKKTNITTRTTCSNNNRRRYSSSSLYLASFFIICLAACTAMNCCAFQRHTWPSSSSTRVAPSRSRLHHRVPLLSSSRRAGRTTATATSTLFQSQQQDQDNNMDDTLDVLICGAGPGGLLLASALSKEGCKVEVVDPALDKPWPNNYGVWMDEAEYFGYGECCDIVWKEAGVVFDEDTPELVLDRPYGRIDRKRMKARLMKECEQHGVNFNVVKATNIQHYDTEPSAVSLSDSTIKKALLVVDATGFAKQFVQHEREFDPGFQVTYGARLRVKDLGPYQLDRMVLMDYSERHLERNPELVKSNYRFPSFVYVMPLKENEIFMEETILVSRPGGSSRDLQSRLELRMEALGIEPLEVLEDERAAIPMGGNDPKIPQRTLGFGATCSLVHPASGYMVARAMEVAPRVAAAIAPKVKQLRENTNGENVDNQLSPGSLDDAAEAGWNAIWPTDERRQRDFMHFGFELLCLLTPQELRDFFTGFFRLPDGLWEHFLSWRLSGIGHVVMGLKVWAQCIPRRFMPPMLIKSIPFIGNRLVGPALSRGNFAPIDTSSLYADARTGNYSVWEPGNFYNYIDELKERDYGDKEPLKKQKRMQSQSYDDQPDSTPTKKKELLARH